MKSLLNLFFGFLMVSLAAWGKSQAVPMNLVKEAPRDVIKSITYVDKNAKTRPTDNIVDFFPCDFSSKNGVEQKAEFKPNERQLDLKIGKDKYVLECVEARVPRGNGYLCTSDSHTVILTKENNVRYLDAELWQNYPNHLLGSGACIKKE